MELARRLDGMFAFAVWDERREPARARARPRSGKKPLYYWSAAGASCSAARSRRCSPIPRCRGELDPGAIPAYLTFGYVPTPRTFFDGVAQPAARPRADLRAGRRAGRRALLGAAGRRASTAAPTLDGSLDEAAARGPRGCSRRRSARRLVSDVPLGAFLSGGIDSSAIVGDHGRASSTGPVETFTIGFDDRDGFDERPYARRRRRAAPAPSTTSSSSTPTRSTSSSGSSGTTTSRSATRARSRPSCSAR